MTCQVWAILVSMFPSFPRYKEGTGGRGEIEPGPSVVRFIFVRVQIIFVRFKLFLCGSILF